MKLRKLLWGVACVATTFAQGMSAAESADSAVTAPTGKYIYIPDSLENDVIQLLKGHSRVVDDDMNLDMTEKVVHKGDTIPMAVKPKNLGRFDRGLSTLLFIPKGTWTIGLTASYGELKTKDLEIMDLLSDIDIAANAFSIKPSISYCIRNNINIGLRFSYYHAYGNVGTLRASVSDDMNFDLKDIRYKSESYSGALFCSQYIGLTRRGRFGIYNEVELAFGSGSSDFRRPYKGQPRNTHTTYTTASLNFSPGVQVFIMKYVSFHVSFGVFGFHLMNEKQVEDGVSSGSRFTSGADFRFNIFNINFGIGIHL